MALAGHKLSDGAGLAAQSGYERLNGGMCAAKQGRGWLT